MDNKNQLKMQDFNFFGFKLYLMVAWESDVHTEHIIPIDYWIYISGLGNTPLDVTACIWWLQSSYVIFIS